MLTILLLLFISNSLLANPDSTVITKEVDELSPTEELMFGDCNEALCGPRVSKCMLIKSCNCSMKIDDLRNKNCTCCKDCIQCLGNLFTDCCSCVGKYLFIIIYYLL